MKASKLFGRGSSYANFRPTYPKELYGVISEYHGGVNVTPPRCIVDVGCGTGQATRALAEHFLKTEKILGVDDSESQLAHAKQHDRVQYVRGVAEHIPILDDHTVDIVTVAQAFHWFDHDTVWPEFRRVLTTKGTLAVWTYGLVHLCNDTASAALYHYHTQVMGPYWDDRRQLVDTNYSTIHFPLADVQRVKVPMAFESDLLQVYEYLGTQSCLKTFREQNGTANDPRSPLLEKLLAAYGTDDAQSTKCTLSFELTLILCRND